MAELDSNVQSNFSTDEEGNRRLSITKKYDVNDSTEEVDAAGNKVQVSHTKDVTKIIASDVVSEYNTIVTEDFIDFGNVDVGQVNKVSYATEEKKSALKGYEEAERVAAAKKQSFLAGANDKVQAGNATNVNGNAYDVRDADSRGDNRTLDVENGNADYDNSGSIHNDSVSINTRQGNKGFADGEGEGHAGAGTGTGMGNGNGNGVGDGTGDGYGTGDGSGDNIESSSNNNRAQSTQVIDSGESLDDSTAAASYAASVTNGAINHIFHNNHYQEDPVPAWSFSVDFVPLCMTDKRFIKLYTLEDSKTLTKAVLTVTANEKTINTQSINYLGLQHPFFTKLAQSHGDLKITFAEDELFSISTILKNVLKYASYLPNFPTNKVYEVKQGDWSDEIVAHNASDSISPKYRLNATDLKITDENTAALVHDYKFVFDILLKIYRPGNAHIFADEAAPPGFVYHFHKCWLKNVGGIELNYDDDKPIDRPVVFSYQYMSGVPYYEWVSRNNVLSESQELNKAYDEAAQQAADAAADAVQEAKEYSKNSPSSFTDNGEPASTSLNNLIDDTKNSRLNYLFK